MPSTRKSPLVLPAVLTLITDLFLRFYLVRGSSFRSLAAIIRAAQPLSGRRHTVMRREF